jgi:hypothetical protein
MAKIGYAKLGRSMTLGGIDNCGTLGGDVEMVPPLKTLALRHPEDTFILIGRNTGGTAGLPSNVVNPWDKWRDELRTAFNEAGLNHANLSVDEHLKCRSIFDRLTLPTFKSLDGIVIWAGQHGTTNSPIPKIKGDELTKPYDWCAYYASFLIRGINVWRDQAPISHQEVWLNADPRNYLKCRDLKWPLHHPVISQFTGEHNMKHYRWGEGWAREWNEYFNVHTDNKDEGVVESTVHTAYSRLEINGLAPGTPFGDLIRFNGSWADRLHFGLFINEARREVAVGKSRLQAVQDWVLQLNPAWIHGKWSQDSQDALGRIIEPADWDEYFPRLNATRTTFTTPSSGSGWATTKPWEAFAAGTVCFFHPDYDVQDNILGDADESLRAWLRVKTPADLKERVRHLNTLQGRADWEWLVRAQKAHFDKAMNELDYMHDIEDRLYGGQG